MPHPVQLKKKQTNIGRAVSPNRKTEKGVYYSVTPLR